jgi:ribulose-phosphate 3-epimerase
MTQILPAILENSFDAIQQKLNRLKGVSVYAQIDIADGVFIPEKTWNDPSQLRKLENGIKLDMHLMVEKPEQWIQECSKDPVFRFTFHQEATYDILRTIKIIKDLQKEVGVAINLDTPVTVLYDILNQIDLVLVMGVNPGAQGREFDAAAIDKVRELREKDQNIQIGVDGGVGPMVAESLINAGANVLVSGSYLFNEDDIQGAIDTLSGKN